MDNENDLANGYSVPRSVLMEEILNTSFMWAFSRKALSPNFAIAAWSNS